MASNSSMDYGSLLQLAKKTSDMKKQAKRSGPNLPPVRTSTDHKNAEEEKKRLLNANVAKFLAKREAEERKRKLEADKVRDGLLAIRNKDSKARKRVKIMNKSAKSADKSAIEDAVGPSDYYVIEEPLCFMSQESLVQEEKFLEKLCKVPQEEIFAKKKANLNKDLSGTKDRVKMALLLGDTIEKKEKREAKEKLKEHNLKEKGRNDSKKVEIVEPQEEEKPKKPRQPRPPPMNYLELLKLAEKLQQEPVREAPKEKEPELRPMTTKERELYLLEEASRRRKEEGYKAYPKKVDKIPSSSQLQGSKMSLSIKEEKSASSVIPRIPKLNDSRPAHEKKSDSYEERKPKSSREDKYGLSNQKPSHRSEENTNNPKPNSRQNENPVLAKNNSNHDKNHIDRMPKAEVTRHSWDERSATSTKSQGTRREKEQSSSSRPSSHQGKPSTMSRDMKEAKPSSSLGIKPTSSSSADGKLSSKKPFDNARNVTSDKSKSQPKPATHSSTKPREYQPDTRVPKKIPSSDIKSHNPHNSKTKQCPPDIKSEQLLPSCKQKPVPSDNKSRQLFSSDSKTKQHNSETKSRSLTPSDSKPKHNSDIKSRQPSLNSKPKQRPTTDEKTASVLKNSKPELCIKSRTLPSSDVKLRNFPSSDVKPRNFPPSDVKPRSLPPSDVKPRSLPSSDVKPKNLPPSDVKPRNFPPSDVKPRKFPPPSNTGPKQFPPADVQRKQFPPSDVRRGPKAPAKKRRIIDSDEEYDSEVADFIDDGPDDCEDYSKHIREIFGYDRSRYRGMNEDDECMESSFSQQMKEEFKSTKLGIMEDLEDIRREKQREAMLKKKRRLK